MSQYKPAMAPPCWGEKYQDGDKECGMCKFNDTCHPAMISKVNAPQTNLSIIRNYSPPIITPPPTSPPPKQIVQSIIPLPDKLYYIPPASIKPVLQPIAQSQPQQTPNYYQQSSGFSLQNPTNPNPLNSMHRPGAPTPAYYFTQYPGESVIWRILKNIFLRAAEAVFAELVQFFRHWTWPVK